MNRSLKIWSIATWLTSSERKVLDLESEVMRGVGSIPTVGNISLLDLFFFSHSRDKNAKYWHFSIVCEKLEWVS